jgi:HSP20 family protein
VTRDAVQVTVNHGLLEISGSRQVRLPDEKERLELKHLEYPFGKFRRTLPLPLGAQTDGLEARIRDGILEIRIPRDSGVVDAKTIHVS